MKIYAEFDNGEKQELQEIQGLQGDCEIVFIRLNSRHRPEEIKVMETALSQKIGKKVILLDCIYGDVFTL